MIDLFQLHVQETNGKEKTKKDLKQVSGIGNQKSHFGL